MPNFCDLISPHDLIKREQQLSILRAFAKKGWQPPAGDDSGISVDYVGLTDKEREELIRIMTEKPKGKRGVLTKR